MEERVRFEDLNAFLDEKRLESERLASQLSLEELFKDIGKPFVLKESLQQQQARVSEMQKEDPIGLSDCMNTGSALLRAVKARDHQELRRIALNIREGDLLFWHTSKAFLMACLSLNKVAVEFMLAGGLDISHSAFEGVIHSVVSLAQSQEADACSRCDMIRLLVSKGVDVNTPLKDTWETPLHVACEKGDLDAVSCLVELGSDVNSVAKDDKMPLSIVQARISNSTSTSSTPSTSTPSTSTPAPAYSEISKLLISKGAKASWRSDVLTVKGTASVSASTKDYSTSEAGSASESTSSASSAPRATFSFNFNDGVESAVERVLGALSISSTSTPSTDLSSTSTPSIANSASSPSASSTAVSHSSEGASDVSTDKEVEKKTSFQKGNGVAYSTFSF